MMKHLPALAIGLFLGALAMLAAVPRPSPTVIAPELCPPAPDISADEYEATRLGMARKGIPDWSLKDERAWRRSEAPKTARLDPWAL